MPFLHEGNNVTITPTQLDYSTVLKAASAASKLNPGAGRFHRILQRNSLPVSSSSGHIQKKVGQQNKFQMAKMLSNGTMSPNMLSSFHRGHESPGSSQNQNDPMFVASRRARSNNFTLKETFDLLKIWASPEMQWQMKHNFRNFRVWEAISFNMHELGHERTAIQCKNRIQNLTSIFYRIKKSKQDYRSFNFPYYKLIGDVLDGKKNGTSSALNPPPGVNLSNSAFSNNSGMTISPSQNNTAGFAAHLALVEEYQHLINGNPDVYITPSGGRHSSSNSNSGMNVLSPEVSLSEGNSPIKMENQISRASGVAGSSAHGGNSVQKFLAGNSRNGGSGSGSLLKMDPDDSVTVTLEDATGDQDQENSDLDDNLHESQDDSPMDGNDVYPTPAGRTKRSFSASAFGSYGKPSLYGLGNGLAAKRPRGMSNATSSSFDDPIGQYLAEMVDIERQWLEMERERADNERAMMMYMMQILQALVCPGQNQEEDNDEDTNEAENDLDGETQEHDADFAGDEGEDNEIHQMIEEENRTSGEADMDGELDEEIDEDQ